MKYNIIGAGQGWNKAPSNEICWGFNTHILYRPYNVLFNMHDVAWGLGGKRTGLWKKAKNRDDALLRCCENDITIFSLGKVGENYIPYPIEEVKKEFSPYRLNVDYFSCGVCYAIALAIYQRATRIDLWGMFIAATEEYAYQKPGIEFWIGVAIGRGIDVRIHGKSHLLVNREGYLYGYNTKQERQCLPL